MTRYEQLRQRRGKLIELNSKNNYMSMVLTKDGLKTNPKSEQYLRLMLQINRETVNIQLEQDKKLDKSNYKFNAYINYKNY